MTTTAVLIYVALGLASGSWWLWVNGSMGWDLSRNVANFLIVAALWPLAVAFLLLIKLSEVIDVSNC